MGQIKRLLSEWMQDQGLHQSDLDEMEDVDAEFKAWLVNHFKKLQSN